MRFAGAEELAATVVHEMKNPLSAVLARIDYMKLKDKDNIFEPDLAFLKSQLKKVDYSIENCPLLIADMNHHRDIVDVYDVVDEVVSEYSERKLKDIEFSLSFDEVEINCVANKAVFAMLISNIIKNSEEAIEHSGKIEISARCENEQIFLNIKDNGCGISPEGMKKLRHGTRHTTKPKGSGIGVPFCRKTIAEWGGIYQINSEQGNGTCVNIILPQYIER